MATVWKTPSGRYRVRVRRRGLPPLSKTFTSRTTAQAWARKAESELERSVYLDTSNAQSLKLSTVLTRYSQEIAATHKGWRQEQSRCKGLRERIGQKTLLSLTPSVVANKSKPFDRKKEHGDETAYGKVKFAEEVVKPNASTIDFSDFTELLSRIDQCLTHNATVVAGSPAAAAAAS